MFTAISSFFREGVKAGLCWLIYRNREQIGITATRAWEGALDNRVVQELVRKLKAHWESSKEIIFWAAIAMIPAVIFGVICPAVILRFPLEQGVADSVGFWGEVVFIGFGAVSVLLVFYVTLKIILIRGLLVFAITTLIHGAKVASDLLPQIVTRQFDDLGKDILGPIVRLADTIEYDALTILMGEGTVLMFITVFGINLDLKLFFLTLVAVVTLVALVVRDRKPPVWLRRAALVMSVISLVVVSSTGIYRSAQGVNSIRQDCIAQYYFYGTPKNSDEVKLCAANVETEIMANLNRFVALNGKPLNEHEQSEWRALDAVIKGLLARTPKPLQATAPPKVTPIPAASAPPPSLTPSAKPKPPKPVANQPAQKTASPDWLAQMRTNHDKAATDLGENKP